MATRNDLQDWVIKALQSLNGRGSIVQVAKYIWDNYQKELMGSGDLFYTWQYDMRWAATKLRQKDAILPAETSFKGEWRLSTKYI